MGLPSGYTLLEYIQSTGTQYINTGYSPSTNVTLEMDLKMSGSFANTKGRIFAGCRSGDYAFFVNFGGGEQQYNELFLWIDKTYEADGAETSVIVPESTIYNRSTLKVQKGKATWGSTSVSLAARNYSTPTPMYLFALNYGGSSTTIFGAYTMTLYGCKIYDNGTLVRDFVPCKNASGAVGLYDTVYGKFYANAGSGTFVAGRAILWYGGKTLVGGTAYYIKNGKTLVNGTAYSVKKGKTLVGGTTYDI